GITLKALYPHTEVHMADKDALVVDYARQNAALNSLSTVQVYGSLGYENLTAHDFDLIISNVPAKAGEPVIRRLLEDAVHHLAPEGQAAVVVIKDLADTVNKMLSANANIQIIRQKDRPGHTVLQYKFLDYAPTAQTDNQAFYSRGVQDFEVEKFVYKLEGAHGLEEFGELNYATKLLLDVMAERPPKTVNNCIVLNPGIGHLAVAAFQQFHPQNIVVVDRDLLSLRFTAKNLALNGFIPENLKLLHRAGFAPDETGAAELIVGILREDEGVAPVAAAIAQMVNALAAKSTLILAGTSTGITRVALTLADDVRLKELTRRKYRGFSAVAYKLQ
ncbi:MAG: methyltransferase, partial [Dehalococcoidales bacterium]|nr:methyltransferase [Dehalococcoidales bacterium]